MSKFRKKPVVIDAFQWRPLSREAQDKAVPDWIVMKNHDIGPGNSLMIHTLEGIMRADPDDWIIRGVKGEIYPCKPDIFAATYEPAE
jgi:hypothetical protein